MNILHTSFECYPIAKVGGLADVVGALPKYQNNSGIQAKVVTPYYDNQFNEVSKRKSVFKNDIHLGEITYRYSVEQVLSPDLGFEAYRIYIKDLIDRPNVYNYDDDTERCIGFQLAVLDWVKNSENIPDVIHCHDHHTGLIPFLITYCDLFSDLAQTPTVLTIHNAQYQGQFSYDKLEYLPPFNHEKIGMLDWNNCINPLASGIKCAWKITAVSPGYMKELQQKANGLEELLYHERNKCVGILNGIDTETWNPHTDTMIIKNYKETHVVSGRKENKKWICNHFNLDINRPLFGFIGRLVGEKGADLLPDIIKQCISETEANMIILGSGNEELEERLQSMVQEYPERYNTHIGYDEKLSHIIYAGVDFLIMPSRVEPCGLNQLYALRYGAIPIVRRTGGLKDTIIDIGEDGGFGICHDHTSVWDVCYSIKRAISLYKDQKKYREIQKEIMKIDHSWSQSAHKYIAIYKSLNNSQ